MGCDMKKLMLILLAILGGILATSGVLAQDGNLNASDNPSLTVVCNGKFKPNNASGENATCEKQQKLSLDKIILADYPPYQRFHGCDRQGTKLKCTDFRYSRDYTYTITCYENWRCAKGECMCGDPSQLKNQNLMPSAIK